MMKLENGDEFMQTWNGIVRKKLTHEIDLKRMYEEEIEERNPMSSLCRPSPISKARIEAECADRIRELQSLPGDEPE
jgi:hypothetical protein